MKSQQLVDIEEILSDAWEKLEELSFEVRGISVRVQENPNSYEVVIDSHQDITCKGYK